MSKREYVQANREWLEEKSKEEGVKALLREIRGFSRPKSGREKYGFRNIGKKG